jgi:LemA protein
MNKLVKWGIVAFIALIVLVVLPASSYNRLVRLSQGTDQSWAQVQNVYQRRADLIPNLVETVKGAANFEKSTLTEIAEARASVGRVTLDANNAPTDAAKLEEFNKAQGQLGAALSRLLVVSERYPELKSTANFSNLQAQLEGSENRISVERNNFNTAVQSYNTAIASFPANLFAGMFGFKSKPYFAAAPTAQTAPQVQFDFNKTATPPPTTAPAK